MAGDRTTERRRELRLGVVKDPDVRFSPALANVARQLGVDEDELIAYATVLRAQGKR